jgi:hypothetical protein
MRLTLTAHGEADPATVWRRYEDVRLWPTWSPQVRGVEAEHDHVAPGLTGHVVGPLGLRLPFVVLAVDPRAMTWRWRVRLGVLDAVLDHRVRPRDPGLDRPGTTTDLVIEAPGAVAIAYRPLAQVALRRLVTV